MGLYENMRLETVSRLSLREPPVLPGDATVRDAVAEMRSRNLGCAVMVDQQSIPCGLLTESSLTKALGEHRLELHSPSRDFMQTDFPTVLMADPILMVLHALERYNTRFLVVVDQDRKLAGLTGQKGLMEYVAEHFPQQVTVQRIGCKPFLAEREGA